MPFRVIAVVALPNGLEISPFASRISVVPCKTFSAEKLLASEAGVELEMIKLPAPILVMPYPVPAILPASNKLPVLLMLRTVSLVSVVVPATRRPLVVVPTLNTPELRVRLLIAA